MRCYVKYDSIGKVIAVGIGSGGEEVSKSEYDTFVSEIKEKANLVQKLCQGIITIDLVTPEWRDEIQRRADERKRMESDPELSEAEALDILLGGAV